MGITTGHLRFTYNSNSKMNHASSETMNWLRVSKSTFSAVFNSRTVSRISPYKQLVSSLARNDQAPLKGLVKSKNESKWNSKSVMRVRYSSFGAVTLRTE